MSELESLHTVVATSSRTTESSSKKQDRSVIKERMILEELIEDVEQKAKVLRQLQAVVEISQASDVLRKEKIKLWAERLGVHQRTVTRLYEKLKRRESLP